jgi:hypothetical protein
MMSVVPMFVAPTLSPTSKDRTAGSRIAAHKHTIWNNIDHFMLQKVMR